MVAFQQVASRQIVAGVVQVEDRLLDVLGRFAGHVAFAQARHAQHVEHQRAVIGDDRPAAFGNDRRMRHAGIVADALDVVDDVVGVFLQRVVDARFEVGLRAVVVDAQAAADVEVLQARAATVQLDIHAGRFVQGLLDVADVGNLAAEMEVQQLEAVLHAVLLQLFERAQDFADRQPELRAVAARALPAAAVPWPPA